MTARQGQILALVFLAVLASVAVLAPLFASKSLAGVPLPGADLPRIWGWWIWATRQSLLLILYTSLVALFIGLPMGIVAGGGGELGELGATRALEFAGRVPSILLVGVLRYWDPTEGVLALACTLALLRTMEVVRVVRDQVASRTTIGFVVGSRAIGGGIGWRLRYHILPGLGKPLLATLAAGASATTGLEAALSYVGLGFPSVSCAWGGGVGTVLVQTDSLPFWGAIFSLVATSFAFRHLASRCVRTQFR